MKSLKEYQAKRKFASTPEPQPIIIESKVPELVFVIHKHQASHLHYDLRLECRGVLVSWAVPKGPSLNPADKRLAMKVEDHPFEYRNFEGNIPKGQYGGGSVMIWDEGTYEIPGAKNKKEAEKIITASLQKGHLEFIFHGKKLQGKFVIVKTPLSEKGNAWLLIKVKDQFDSKKDVTKQDRSVRTFRSMEEIKNEESESGQEKMPEVTHPMLAVLVKEPFDRKGWIFEIKWDGYRAITKIQNGKVKITSRNDLSFNARFPSIVKELENTQVNSAIFDGEIVIVDEKGRSNFQLMQNYQRTQKGNLLYYLFDILYLNGRDLCELPLIERKEILKKMIENENFSLIRYSDHIDEKGIAFFKIASKEHLEGIVCKNGQSHYLMKRSKEWLKVKTKQRQEFVIGGFTEPRGSRNKFGSLLIGYYEGRHLIYAGHVGGGFSEKLLKEVHKQLEPLIQEKCPFKSCPEKATWVKPKLVCEVEFAEWTDEGILRQPIFQGIRLDKNPKDVKKE